MIEVTEQYMEEMQAKITAYREENYLQHKKIVELEQGEWYWKQRCEAAEAVIDSFPINLTIAKERDNKKLKEWRKIKNQQ